ncbi:hypothetical protein EVAR_98846_1 [Eumeta japonica]|uniref:Uncharacterized protein n=1 Tax=Eumeta variegata TaxID=151549 RepID=A0A4C1YM30_EUMVA|nr:hypothetical protein EVAR_98846_1 [Eumeta japonica]
MESGSYPTVKAHPHKILILIQGSDPKAIYAGAAVGRRVTRASDVYSKIDVGKTRACNMQRATHCRPSRLALSTNPRLTITSSGKVHIRRCAKSIEIMNRREFNYHINVVVSRALGNYGETSLRGVPLCACVTAKGVKGAFIERESLQITMIVLWLEKERAGRILMCHSVKIHFV